MNSATVSRRSRRFVIAAVCFLLLWQVGVVAGLPRATQVVLGLLGFVLHFVFGKAYALVPSYFDRQLALSWPISLHLGASTGGVLALAAWTASTETPPTLGAIGGVLWTGGVACFLGTLGWTVRDNLSGAETGTSEANIHREPTDRLANAVVPVALGYLAVGTYELLALTTGLPPMLSGGLPVVAHLLAVGMATTMLLGIGFRLLPRFLVASPPYSLVGVVLASGAIGPAFLVFDFRGGVLFRVGAMLEAIAIVGFAASYLLLFHRTDRDRVGFYGVLAGVLSGIVGVGLGLSFAAGVITPVLVVSHLRLNVLGFLGLSIVGVAYQFYPPAVGVFPGCNDRTALVSLLLLAGGLWIEVIGRSAGMGSTQLSGSLLGLVGTVLFAYLLAGVFRRQTG